MNIFSKIFLVVGIYTIMAEENRIDLREFVAPTEDLMREHGILNRILLIYEEIISRIVHNEEFDLVTVNKGAQIIREFIEDYHEKNEEKFIFPKFKENNKLSNLVDILLEQHQIGRAITAKILELSSHASLPEKEKLELAISLNNFTHMYRAHESREDTEVFPELAKLATQEEIFNLGEQFEKTEHQLFGPEGFKGILKRVQELEVKLGIENLETYSKKS